MNMCLQTQHKSLQVVISHWYGTFLVVVDKLGDVFVAVLVDFRCVLDPDDGMGMGRTSGLIRVKSDRINTLQAKGALKGIETIMQ